MSARPATKLRPALPPPPVRPRLNAKRRGRMPSVRRLRWRRFLITWAKWLLPLTALALLGALAFWPNVALRRLGKRLTLQSVANLPVAGDEMTAPRYRGVDARGQPFTLSAARAVEERPGLIRLTNPEGNITLKSGTRVLLQSRYGFYHRNRQLLDLSQRVQLYRDDGTTLRTAAASIDLEAGTAEGEDPTYAQGSFGTLTASGFRLFDHGAVIRFLGPATLVLSGAGS